MAEKKRGKQPSESAPEFHDPEDAPKPEEVLSERVSETAEAVIAELEGLNESLVPAEPIAETVVEQVAEAETAVELAAEGVAAPAGESGEVVVETAEIVGEQAAGIEEMVEETPAEETAVVEAAALPGDTAGRMPKSAAEVAESSSDDRLVSALAWLSMVILQLPIVSIVQLLSVTNRERPFQRHHAVTSLLFYAGGIVYEIVAGIAYVILGLLTLGIGFACLWVIFFVPHLFGLYFALQAYNGKRVELPGLSSFGRNQGWI